jgi:ABC-type Fe3+/spermidine/putrescine transport system ATPase subunit
VREQLREEIRRIQLELGVTTLFVTHDQEEAMSIADRIGVMNRGRLEQCAAPDTLYARPATAFVAEFVGTMNRLPGVAEDGGTVRIGGGTSTGNDVSNHTEGIRLIGTSCVYVGYNTAHDNRDWSNVAFAAAGIRLSNSPNNHIRSNISTKNGDDEFDVPLPDSGILVNGAASAASLLVENQVNRNRGSGITTSVGAATNEIVNNQMLFNDPPPFADAYSDQSGVNTWNENNRCQTQTTPQPPPGVCNPGEVPPPQ